MQDRYSVRVVKDSLVFSAAHFITYAGGQCERLHGHNYRVEVEAAGPLDANGYVLDFLAVRDAALGIVAKLDHRMLLPGRSALIAVATAEGRTTARFGAREWSFPADECVVLPLANTTAELLARWIGGELCSALLAVGAPRPETLAVSVEENFGQWARCVLGLTGESFP